jgi:hypothetical protein
MKSHPPDHPSCRLLPRSLAVCTSLAGVLMLAPGQALSQINDTEGDWKGTLSCGALKIKSTRAGPAYSHPLALRAVVGGLTGQRDTASTQERFTGSLERSGKATLQGSGAWRDDPARSWRFRLQGQYQGAALRLDGFMESSDGKIRLRDCGADLTQVRPVTSSLPPVRTSPPTAPSQTTKSTPPPTLPATHVDALAQQKKQKQQKEAEELAAQVAREKALADKALAEKALIDKAIADKALAEKAQADKARQDLATQAAQQAAQMEAARLALDKAQADKRALEIKNREAKKETIKARSSMDL